MSICIWCKKIIITPTLEHIIPEALGCPEGFHIELCSSCNNGLGHLDQAVIDEFDFSIFNAGISRKGGKPSIISNRGNMVGRATPHGRKISINMGNYPVITSDGTRIAPYRGSDRDIRAKTKQYHDKLEIQFSLPIFDNPKFIRGIYKIALSSLAYFLGTELASKSNFDKVRGSVKDGKGTRKILVRPCSDTTFQHRVDSPRLRDEDGYVIPIRL